MIKRLVLELDEETHKRVKQKALNQGLSMRCVLSNLLKKWLEDK